MNESNTELVRFNAGAADGQSVRLHRRRGELSRSTAARASTAWSWAAAINSVDGIRGRSCTTATAEAATCCLNDIADTTGDIVHVDASTIGAYAGDTFFGPGGSLAFPAWSTSAASPTSR